MAFTPLQLVSVPLIGGLIGWGTNWLAVRMLFRPRREINLLGIRIQGLVPRRHADLANSIGHTVDRHLIRHEDIAEALARAQAGSGIDALLSERTARFIDVNLKQIHPMVGMLLTGAMRKKLEDLLLAEVASLLPEVGEKLIAGVEDELDFQKIVEERVRNFDLGQLEKMIMDISHRELRAIEIWGGVLGVLIGCIQLGVMML